jgi:hypothetical protein
MAVWPVATAKPAPAGLGSRRPRHRECTENVLAHPRASCAVLQRRRTPLPSAVRMTAKEKLRELVDELSEVEAAEALDILAARRRHDPIVEFLENAPRDDEPVSAEEEAAVQVAREEIARGETISLDELRTELH